MNRRTRSGFLPWPAAVALCEELGLTPELVRTRTTVAYVWTVGGLRQVRGEGSPYGGGRRASS